MVYSFATNSSRPRTCHPEMRCSIVEKCISSMMHPQFYLYRIDHVDSIYYAVDACKFVPFHNLGHRYGLKDDLNVTPM